MTLHKKLNASDIQKQAKEWLKIYSQNLDFDINHPAVQAIYNLAICGSLSNKDNPSLRGLFLQMQEKALRSEGATYEEAVEKLAADTGITIATIKRLLKHKAEMPIDISDLEGQQSLLKILFIEAQKKSSSKQGLD
jgi:hypothetical protein